MRIFSGYPDPDNAYLPSGEKATERTSLVCPANVLIAFPVVTSQSVMVLLSFAANAYFPSGENATDTTLAIFSVNVLISFPVATSQSVSDL